MRWKRLFGIRKGEDVIEARVVMKTAKRDILEAWFADKVAKYDGAGATSTELYRGYGGSLYAYATRCAPDGVDIMHLRYHAPT